MKLLDFGLGKAVGARSVESEAKLSTDTSPTDAGVLLGTAPYMSPEQARGEAVDQRTDIWAFGCVLYEMLTGKRAFAGPTVADMIAAILQREPDWSALPPDTPPQLRSILRRCLTKDSFRRLHAIADARIELEEALTSGFVEAPPRAVASTRWLAIGAAMSLGVALGGGVSWRLTRRSSTIRHSSMRFNIAFAEGSELSKFPGQPLIAISPDGRRLLYEADGGGIYIRSLDRVETRIVPGTEGGSHPFFSPDGRWIGFVAGGKLQKVSADGGAPRPIADASQMRGASWGEDGTIVYTPTNGQEGLHRISAEGGTPHKLTDVTGLNEEDSHRWPQILPGGTAVLFTIWPLNLRVQDARIAIVSLQTGHLKVIVEGGTCARYVPTGHLVYGVGGTVFAAPFDIGRLELAGPAVQVLENVRMAAHTTGPMGRNWSRTGIAQFAFSAAGVLAYVTPHDRPAETQLLWIDRKGSAVSLSQPRRAYTNPNPSLSPDDGRLVVSVDEADGGTNLWLHDRNRQTWTQLTFEKTNESAHWSPRGDVFVFASNREGLNNLFVMPSDGGVARRLTTNVMPQLPTGWSPDGQTVVFRHLDPKTFWDIWEVPLGRDNTPRPLVIEQGFQGAAKLSPDGRWLAYASSQSGSSEVYVRPYPRGDRRWTISTDGGFAPLWSRTTNEIFYMTERAGMYKVIAVPVTRAPTFRPGPPRTLFERRGDQYGYDAATDGQHFVVAEATDWKPEHLQIVVIPDWFEELKAKVPLPR